MEVRTVQRPTVDEEEDQCQDECSGGGGDVEEESQKTHSDSVLVNNVTCCWKLMPFDKF